MAYGVYWRQGGYDTAWKRARERYINRNGEESRRDFRTTSRVEAEEKARIYIEWGYETKIKEVK